MIRALPGDPLETLIAETGTSVPAEALRAELHLDKPFGRALVEDVSRFARGDLGVSILSRRPVAPLLAERFLKTLQLTLLAISIALAGGIALGVAAALRPGSAVDRLCTIHGALSAALPMPWIGPVLMLLFCVWIPAFPTGDHVALPALALSLSAIGTWSRLVRERVGETLRFGSASGARSRGVPEWKVALKYGFAPCSGALVAYFGAQLGSMLAGAFVVETIFDWRGMGSLIVDAVLKRDYPVIEAATFVAAATTLLGTTLGDALQFWIDPRLGETGGKEGRA